MVKLRIITPRVRLGFKSRPRTDANKQLTREKLPKAWAVDWILYCLCNKLLINSDVNTKVDM